MKYGPEREVGPMSNGKEAPGDMAGGNVVKSFHRVHLELKPRLVK